MPHEGEREEAVGTKRDSLQHDRGYSLEDLLKKVRNTVEDIKKGKTQRQPNYHTHSSHSASSRPEGVPLQARQTSTSTSQSHFVFKPVSPDKPLDGLKPTENSTFQFVGGQAGNMLHSQTHSDGHQMQGIASTGAENITPGMFPAHQQAQHANGSVQQGVTLGTQHNSFPVHGLSMGTFTEPHHVVQNQTDRHSKPVSHRQSLPGGLMLPMQPAPQARQHHRQSLPAPGLQLPIQAHETAHQQVPQPLTAASVDGVFCDYPMPSKKLSQSSSTANVGPAPQNTGASAQNTGAALQTSGSPRKGVSFRIEDLPQGGVIEEPVPARASHVGLAQSPRFVGRLSNMPDVKANHTVQRPGLPARAPGHRPALMPLAATPMVHPVNMGQGSAGSGMWMARDASSVRVQGQGGVSPRGPALPLHDIRSSAGSPGRPRMASPGRLDMAGGVSTPRQEWSWGVQQNPDGTQQFVPVPAFAGTIDEQHNTAPNGSMGMPNVTGPNPYASGTERGVKNFRSSGVPPIHSSGLGNVPQNANSGNSFAPAPPNYNPNAGTDLYGSQGGLAGAPNLYGSHGGAAPVLYGSHGGAAPNPHGVRGGVAPNLYGSQGGVAPNMYGSNGGVASNSHAGMAPNMYGSSGALRRHVASPRHGSHAPPVPNMQQQQYETLESQQQQQMYMEQQQQLQLLYQQQQQAQAQESLRHLSLSSQQHPNNQNQAVAQSIAANDAPQTYNGLDEADRIAAEVHRKIREAERRKAETSPPPPTQHDSIPPHHAVPAAHIASTTVQTQDTPAFTSIPVLRAPTHSAIVDHAPGVIHNSVMLPPSIQASSTTAEPAHGSSNHVPAQTVHISSIQEPHTVTNTNHQQLSMASSSTQSNTNARSATHDTSHSHVPYTSGCNTNVSNTIAPPSSLAPGKNGVVNLRAAAVQDRVDKTANPASGRQPVQNAGKHVVHAAGQEKTPQNDAMGSGNGQSEQMRDVKAEGGKKPIFERKTNSPSIPSDVLESYFAQYLGESTSANATPRTERRNEELLDTYLKMADGQGSKQQPRNKPPGEAPVKQPSFKNSVVTNINNQASTNKIPTKISAHNTPVQKQKPTQPNGGAKGGSENNDSQLPSTKKDAAPRASNKLKIPAAFLVK